ncbi:MAG: NAD(P)/FAD-dependent oxidoreductase [bacterium]
MVEGIADVVIAGGGIVGCSVALEISRRASSATVFLLEKGSYLGDGTSTRNSYVLHAGIYYPEDSLKARFCVAGNRALVAFCERHAIPCVRTGKLVLASSQDEVSTLEKLESQGERNGVEGLRLLDAGDIRKKEPAVRAFAALYVPSTGVFDVAQWFRTVEGLLYAQGVIVLKRTPVVGLEVKGGWVEVETERRGTVGARCFVNAAGLHADEVANLLGSSFRIHPVRGDYFSIAGRKADLVSGAVYPCPGSLGLGIHLTKLWDGTVLVGPDARYAAGKEDYRTMPVFTPEGDLDPQSPDFLRFFLPVKQFFPGLEKEDLRLAHCGIRPCLRAPGEEGFRDFQIQADRNCRRVIHLIGIDSPGLTASPAIASHVADMVSEILTG